MTDHPPPEDASRSAPGFVACGAMVLLALIGFGVIAGAIAAVTSPSIGNTITGVLALAGLVATGVRAIRDPQFARCVAKGLAAVAAFFVIVFGACLAIIAGSGI